MVNLVTYTPEQVIVPSFLPDIPQVREELAQYYQSVSRLDQGIARLISILKKAGRYDNSLIIYISDNGIAFPGAKTTLYDPGIKLPCIVKVPGQKVSASVTEAMISWTDITPSILDYAGVKYTPEELHGRSLRPVLESPLNTEGWDKVFASHSLHEITMYYPMRMVRTRQYKLIWNVECGNEFPFAWDLYESATWKGIINANLDRMGKRRVENFKKRPEFELYDITADPDEVINLASDKKYSEILEELKNEVKEFQKRTNDPWLYKWDYQ
jgi:N-sulfoglucosamine sulfohydrolase